MNLEGRIFITEIHFQTFFLKFTGYSVTVLMTGIYCVDSNVINLIILVLVTLLPLLPPFITILINMKFSSNTPDTH